MCKKGKKHHMRSDCYEVLCKIAFQKISQIHREISVLESLSDAINGLQEVRLATVLTRDSRTGVSQRAVCRCSTK